MTRPYLLLSGGRNKKFKKDCIPLHLKMGLDGSRIQEGKTYKEYLEDQYGHQRAKRIRINLRSI